MYKKHSVVDLKRIYFYFRILGNIDQRNSDDKKLNFENSLTQYPIMSCTMLN